MPNNYLPHVLVLPEDDANRQLVIGFLLEPALALRERSIQVLPPAGGWGQVIERFKSDYVASMNKYAGRFMILLIDFDKQADRLDHVRRQIPDELEDRVFIIGAWSEPEELKLRIGPYEEVGKALASDCYEDTYATWRHDLLQHNAGELERLRRRVRPLLFGP